MSREALLAPELVDVIYCSQRPNAGSSRPLCALKQYTGRIQVRQANSDGREQDRYRKSILRFSEEKSQVHAT